MGVYYLVAMVIRVYMYVQTQQTVYLNYVQFLYTNYTSVKQREERNHGHVQ